MTKKCNEKKHSYSLLHIPLTILGWDSSLSKHPEEHAENVLIWCTQRIDWSRVCDYQDQSLMLQNTVRRQSDSLHFHRMHLTVEQCQEIFVCETRLWYRSIIVTLQTIPRPTLPQNSFSVDCRPRRKVHHHSPNNPIQVVNVWLPNIIYLPSSSRSHKPLSSESSACSLFYHHHRFPGREKQMVDDRTVEKVDTDGMSVSEIRGFRWELRYAYGKFSVWHRNNQQTGTWRQSQTGKK